MKRVFLTLILLSACSGCPPQPKPTPPPFTDMHIQPGADMSVAGTYGLSNCPATMTVSFTDVCDGMFTSAGLACAHCSGATSCFDSVDVIYCASGSPGCLEDAACIHVQDGSSGVPASTKKKTIRKIPTKLKRPS